MNNQATLDTTFEPALVKEIHQFGIIKNYREGDTIMDYGKYIRMMPLVIKGTIKVYRKDDAGNEILLYYLSNNESCSMTYSCCMEAKKSEVKAIAEDEVELIAIPHIKLDERLIAYLKEKQRLTGSSVIKASHSLIADELATSRVVVSRLLKQLENEQKIILYRTEIKILKDLV